MTPDRIKEVAKRQLDELFDNYVLIAFTPEGQPVACLSVATQLGAIGINNALGNIIGAGGVHVPNAKE